MFSRNLRAKPKGVNPTVTGANRGWTGELTGPFRSHFGG